MACCRRSPKSTTILQQVASKRRSVGVITPKQPLFKPDRRVSPTAMKPSASILCKHFEKKGAELLVDVTPERKILFQASGSTFDLEENIELYGCTGKVPTFVKAIRRNLNKLEVAPTSKRIALGELLAATIELLKKEA